MALALTMLERSSIIVTMNMLSVEKQAAVIQSLAEGNSIRATARMTGTAKRTVSNLLRDVGAHAKNYHDRFVIGLQVEQIQADEIWSFVGCKERRVPEGEKGKGRGDVWTFTAIDRSSKLLIGYRVGNRTVRDALGFMLDLRGRVKGHVQVSTDGHRMYRWAIERAFGWNRASHGVVEKVYGTSPEGTRRYSPPVCLGCEKKARMGAPDMAMVSTSHVERQNLNMRMTMRRFTRLTNGFSKKVEYHLYAVALHVLYHNYVKVHGTLTKQRGGIKTTPAMAAGLTTRPWTVYDVLSLLQGE